MSFERYISPIVVTSFLVVIVISVVLAFLPLIGTLGFEYSSITAVLLSFVTVATSASLIANEDNSRNSQRNSLQYAGSIYLIGFLLLLTAFIIGVISSIVKEDCYIREGALFFLLITSITVFFSTSIGLSLGYFLGRKGILIGLVTILIILLYSLWKFYHGISIFVYNPIFGFFPGPLYDEAIPITTTLIISRITVLFWGILILTFLYIVDGIRQSLIRIWSVFLLTVLLIAIIAIHLYEAEIGISYSRDYITQNVLSGSVETDNFIIYYDPGSKVAKDIDLIKMDHEWRYKQLYQALELESDEKIKSYIYPDIDTRKKLIGAGETTIANPLHNEIHLVYDSFPHPVLKHELVHVMAGEFGNDLIKISPKIGLLEGAAVAVDWRGERYNPHQWSRVILETGVAPNIKNIAGFGFWYAPSDISYTIMGSLSRYLIDNYGIDKYKTAYKTGSFSVYGKSVDELEKEWMDYVSRVETPSEVYTLAEARFSRPSIFHATCPRKIAELKSRGYQNFEDDNYFQARKQFSKALEYDGSDPNLIYWLAYSQYYDGNYDRALKIASSTSAESQMQKDLLTNLEGNSIWQSGDSKKAQEIFGDLQSHQLPDSLRRELEIKLSAIKSTSDVQENIRNFFGTQEDILQLTYLQNAILADPNFGPSYYLKGRFYFNEGIYEKAVPELIRAYLLELPTIRLKNENLRLLGISLFARGRYDQSIAVFEELMQNEENEQAIQYVVDFIERNKWMKKISNTNKTG